MMQLLADVWDLLAYQRGKANSPRAALVDWLRGVRDRLTRARRVGAAQFAELLEAERACLAAGLLFAHEDAGQVAPWHLPERFLRLQGSALPSTGPFDTDAVVPLLGAEAAAMRALDLLVRLTAPDGFPDRWATLNVGRPKARAHSGARLAVCVHLYYPELWSGIRTRLQALPEQWDLVLTVPEFSVSTVWRQIEREIPSVQIVPVLNRGRDVWPWIHALRTGMFEGYDFVCKLHGKRSPHMQGAGDAWRDELLEDLIGTDQTSARLVAALRSDPLIGLLGPASAWRGLPTEPAQHTNRRHMASLMRRLNLPQPSAEHGFFAGTMFWFRPRAMAPLVAADLSKNLFEREMGQTDGTAAHALERLIPLVANKAGYRVLRWPVDPERAISLSPPVLSMMSSGVS